MGIGETLAALRKEQGMTQAVVCEALASKGTQIKVAGLSSWEQGRTQPSLQAFFQLCRLYHVGDVLGVFCPEEGEALNDEGMRKLAEYRQLLIDSGHYALHPSLSVSTTKVIRLYDLPVSAGTGELLDGCSYTELRLPNLPEGTDFALRIAGDSMQPRYQNHQMVFCHHQETLEDGEIGIFALNGQGYCKKLEHRNGKPFLVSLNPSYHPIPIQESDTLRVFARVLN